jgi:hypothetical protein
LTSADRGAKIEELSYGDLNVKLCLGILLAFSLFAPTSFAQGTKENPPPAPAIQAQPADAGRTTELTIVSTPDGADIEVDGAFVGNTPSTVALANGDHTVRVIRKGYRPYEKKLRTSGGSVSLRAELEAVQSQPTVNENINANVTIDAPKPSTIQTPCLIINREIQLNGPVWNQGRRRYMYVDSYNLSPRFVKTQYKDNDVTEIIKEGVRVIVVNSSEEIKDARISCQGQIPQR